MKSLLLAALLLATVLALAPQAAAPSRAAALSPQPIIMGVPSRGWPPYHMAEGSSQGYGAMTDIFVEASLSLGHPVQLMWMPEKRAVQAMTTGTIDIYTKAKEWVAEPDAYLWSDPIMASEDVLVFRRGESFAFSGVEDLKGHVLGTVLGYRYPRLEPLFQSGQCRRMDASNALNQMRMLLHLRTNVAVINRHVALWLIRKNRDLRSEDFEFSDQALGTAQVRFAFNMGHPWGSYIRDFNREIALMRSDGRMQAILDRYQ